MAWFMDTYSQQVGFSVPGAVTGKPLAIGGSLGREEATGQGVVYVTLEALRKKGLALEDTTVVIQGFGTLDRTRRKSSVKPGLASLASVT